MGKRLRISCVYGFQISHVKADTVLNYLNVICLLNSNSAGMPSKQIVILQFYAHLRPDGLGFEYIL